MSDQQRKAHSVAEMLRDQANYGGNLHYQTGQKGWSTESEALRAATNEIERLEQSVGVADELDKLSVALLRAFDDNGHRYNCSSARGSHSDCTCGWLEVMELVIRIKKQRAAKGPIKVGDRVCIPATGTHGTVISISGERAKVQYDHGPIGDPMLWILQLERGCLLTPAMPNRIVAPL